MRLIDADDFIEYLGLNAENSREENLGEIVTLEDFDRQPIIEAEPVRHGRWIFKHDVDKDPKRYFVRIVCSNCNLHTGQKSNYCPQCGAKMDLDD